jgi:methylated-DNA-[protein]-cysteine S-methyltransferase
MMPSNAGRTQPRPHGAASGGSPFTVETDLTALAVTVEGDAVTRIELNRRGARAPRDAIERRVAGELAEYAAGRRTRFSFRTAPRGTDFDRRVWDAVARIPYGETKSYGEIAASIGSPGAARAVGTANGRNPVPPVIPCHRVVAAGGRLGGYGGGLDLKRRLLDLETARRPRRAGPRAGTLLGALALVIAAACGEPERPIFSEPEVQQGDDNVGPTVEFLLPAPTDSVFQAGTTINVRLRILDNSNLASVDARVGGEMAFVWPQWRPVGSIFEVTYQINVPANLTGTILFRVSATDDFGNRTSRDRTFIVQ